MNRYATPVYRLQTRITTSKYSEKQPNMVPGLVDASFFLKGIRDMYEEIPTLLSPSRIGAAVDRLKYRVSYFSKGFIKTVETPKGVGFDVKVDTVIEADCPFDIPIFVNQIDESSFMIHILDDSWEKRVGGKKYFFGSFLKLGKSIIKIKNTNGRINESDKYYFVLNRRSSVINEYRSKLQINWALRGSSMLDISLPSELPERDILFLNAYYNVIAEMGLKEKTESLNSTIVFIDEQMKYVTDSLLYYQAIMDKMKLKDRKLMLGTDYIFTEFKKLDEAKANIILNERYFDYLTDYFDANSNQEVFAPSVNELSIKPGDEWVSKFMEDKLKEKLFKTEENAKNPLINREDSLKRKLVKGIYESIRSARERNQEELADINKQTDELYSSISDVQVDYREFSGYMRVYQLNLTLFDLFIKRKTEAAISKASATSDYKIIDAPYYSRVPFRPDKQFNLLLAALLGLFLPIGFFLYRDFTNPTVVDKDDIQDQTSMPLLGNIPHSPYEPGPVTLNYPRSVVTESFRAVRASLKYVASGSACNTFLVTSSVAGEGKTFCSINLAYSLGISNKKTILIGADLRKPAFKKYLEVQSSPGLSEYLAGIATIEEVLSKGNLNLPDIINSGNTPPNPSELLVSDRMKELLAHLKTLYEYIIIDTAPIGIVSDALELLKYTDFNLLIIRQNITPKGALKMVSDLYEEGKLKNFSVIFNDVAVSDKRGRFGSYVYGIGYGGYGYGYYEEDSSGKRKRRKKSAKD